MAHNKTDMFKVRKAFYKSAEFKNIVRIGAAVYDPGLDGEFEGMINAKQGEWAPLHPVYAKQKQQQGHDSRKWVRTGRTLKALSQGELPRREGTSKGVRFKVNRQGRKLIAMIRPAAFRGSGKKPPAAIQKKIWKNLNWGIDVGGKAASQGRLVKDKRGRLLNRRPGRDLMTGWAKGMESQISKSVEKETAKILSEGGLVARVRL